MHKCEYLTDTNLHFRKAFVWGQALYFSEGLVFEIAWFRCELFLGYFPCVTSDSQYMIFHVKLQIPSDDDYDLYRHHHRCHTVIGNQMKNISAISPIHVEYRLYPYRPEEAWTRGSTEHDIQFHL
jgi:hypothetical protein